MLEGEVCAWTGKKSGVVQCVSAKKFTAWTKVRPKNDSCFTQNVSSLSTIKLTIKAVSKVPRNGESDAGQSLLGDEEKLLQNLYLKTLWTVVKLHIFNGM